MLTDKTIDPSNSQKTLETGAGLRIVAADDEPLALELLLRTIRTVRPDAQVTGFSRADDLLAYIKDKPCDVAFLDIRLRGTNGIELAAELKRIAPQLNLIFVTGYDQYAVDALTLHASGYILKPVTCAKVERELADLRHPCTPTLLRVQCFGNFEVFGMDGRPLHFSRSKAKETLAYLVHRRGASCTVREVAAVLFEDEPYDVRKCQYVQKIYSSLQETLRAAGAGSVLLKQYNSLAIDTAQVDCDYYRLLRHDPGALRTYRQEYMSQYSWAEAENASLSVLASASDSLD